MNLRRMTVAVTVVTGVVCVAAAWSIFTGDDRPVLIGGALAIIVLLFTMTVFNIRDRRESLALAQKEERAAIARMKLRGEIDTPQALESLAKRNVRLVPNPYYGGEWQCEPGETEQPQGCERHSTHHWCGVCEGWYGVPHERIHEGSGAHPYGNSDPWTCACRPCKIRTGRE